MSVAGAYAMLRRSIEWRDAWVIEARVAAWNASECPAARLIRKFWYGVTHGRCSSAVPIQYTLFGTSDPAALWREAEALAASMSVAERAMAGLGVVPAWTMRNAREGGVRSNAMVDVNPLLLQTLAHCEGMLDAIEAAQRKHRRAARQSSSNGDGGDPAASVHNWIEVIDLGSENVPRWWSRALRAMGTVRALAPVCDSNYPEVLRRVFVIRAPKAFAVIHGWAKPLMDESTAEKVCVFGSSGRELAAFVHAYVECGGRISQLPPQLAGACDFDADGALAVPAATMRRVLRGVVVQSDAVRTLGGFSRWDATDAAAAEAEASERDAEALVLASPVWARASLVSASAAIAEGRAVAAPPPGVSKSPSVLASLRRRISGAPSRAVGESRAAPRAACCVAPCRAWLCCVGIVVAAFACALLLVWRSSMEIVVASTPVLCAVAEVLVLAAYCSAARVAGGAAQPAWHH
jgi:hypothetical protein